MPDVYGGEFRVSNRAALEIKKGTEYIEVVS